MADVFISYKREDRPQAEALARALIEYGYSVWWDFELLSGQKYRAVIAQAIDECKAAVVLWSARANDSQFVIDEADRAHRADKLCPVRLDAATPPLGYGGMHSHNFTGWTGDLEFAPFEALLRGIAAKTGKQPMRGARPGPEQASPAEVNAFKTAQLANNASALRTFLQDYPDGAFAGFVRRQIANMEAGVRSAFAVPPSQGALQRYRREAPPATGGFGLDNSGREPTRRGLQGWVLLLSTGTVAAAVLALLVWVSWRNVAPPPPSAPAENTGTAAAETSTTTSSTTPVTDARATTAPADASGAIGSSAVERTCRDASVSVVARGFRDALKGARLSHSIQMSDVGSLEQFETALNSLPSGYTHYVDLQALGAARTARASGRFDEAANDYARALNCFAD